eukprot:14565757-Alexandrium_andersonii.AAC.1
MAACIRSRLAELDGGSPASTARSRTPVRSVHEPPVPPPGSAAKAAAAMGREDGLPLEHQDPILDNHIRKAAWQEMVDRSPRASTLSPTIVLKWAPETKAEHDYIGGWADGLVAAGAATEA